MPVRFCRAQVHISVVTYFHNNSLLACVETNRIKTSCFEAKSNENKIVTFTNNVFYRNGLSGQRHL